MALQANVENEAPRAKNTTEWTRVTLVNDKSTRNNSRGGTRGAKTAKKREISEMDERREQPTFRAAPWASIGLELRKSSTYPMVERV